MCVFPLLDNEFCPPFYHPIVLCARYLTANFGFAYLEQFCIFSEICHLWIHISFLVTCECSRQIPWDRLFLPVLVLLPLTLLVGSGKPSCLIPGHLKLFKSFSWGIWPKAFLKWKYILPRSFLQCICEARFLSTIAMLARSHSSVFI